MKILIKHSRLFEYPLEWEWNLKQFLTELSFEIWRKINSITYQKYLNDYLTLFDS